MSKQEAIYRQLQELILNGYYKPGDPIIERVVAEELGASRIPVRAALLQLEQDGLVTLIPNRGATVRIFSHSDLRDLFVTRMALDGMAARLAALHMDPHELEPIESEYRKILDRNEAPDSELMVALGSEFHDKITVGCGNPVIARMSVSISDQVRLSRRLYFPHTSHEQMLRFAKQHIRIVAAIRQRDPDLAERLMREHIAETYDMFQISLNGLGLKMNEN